MNEIPINPSHFFLLTAVLNAIGKAIKDIPHLGNYWIPFILWVCGGTIHGLLAGWTAPNVIVGVVAATTAGGLHQGVQMAKAIVQQEKKQEPPSEPK